MLPADLSPPIIEDAPPDPPEFTSWDQPLSPQTYEEPAPEPEAPTEDEMPPEEDPFADQALSDKPDIFDSAEPPPTHENVGQDLSDIARFGNSDSTSSRDGILRYNIIIEGIDTSDVREAFREALTDRKFMWDTDELLRSIHHGEVRIENVVASKAFVLVARLRSLPLKIRWEQYAVHSN